MFVEHLIMGVDVVLTPRRFSALHRYTTSPMHGRRTPLQTRALWLLRDLYRLWWFAPPAVLGMPCYALVCDAREPLCAFFDLNPQFDFYAEANLMGLQWIESNLKPGTIERARATHRIALRARKRIEELERLVIADDRHSWILGVLSPLCCQLAFWPSLEALRATDPELFSNKYGWPDWLRHVTRDLDLYFHPLDFKQVLSATDWAALVDVLFDESVSEQRILQVIR
ncbi:hypothetical protein IAI53_07590 [Thauera sp. CAU 1555]|uniref:Uncharacterized protein n=1 Tax=Thauera sedimentorum TaxID=2767595 RepID=A0ABR9BBD3_9RHOO|nr:hypothetical protein [Thauera sedimentorum]MBC9071828.1 hypothetical protein [Thauera sedimentorum]MBD8502747.1 hypothetical protein [Thauera sedimentorum]